MVQKISEAPQSKLHLKQKSQKTLARKKAILKTKSHQQEDKLRQDLEYFNIIKVFMLASVDVLEHLISRHIVTVTASGKTVYNDILEHFLEAILRLQKHNFLVKRVYSYLLQEKPKRDQPGVDTGAQRLNNKKKHLFDDPMWYMNLDDIFYYGEIIYISPIYNAKIKMLQKHHDDFLAGYFEHAQTLKLVCCKYY